MRWWCFLVVAGCYSPTLSPGSPCTEQGTCPGDLVCEQGRCVLPGGPGRIDSPSVVHDTNTDALGDAFPIDAPTDGAIDAPILPIDAPAAMPWGAPVALGSGVNTSATESDPSITEDRLTIYFTRVVGGNEDIYMATRATPSSAFGTATAVTTLNSVNGDRSPEITDDGSAMLFTSDRSGNQEVYVSFRVASSWTTPAVVTELSGAADENDVAVSPNRLTAIIARGPSGARKLFRSTRANTIVAWGTPTEITELSVAGDPAAPTVTNGGATIYFHVTAMNRDIVTAAKPGATYSTPTPVTELNTAVRDAAPFILQGNSYMLFERAGTIYETSR